MKVAIISSQGNDVLKKCVDSLLDTAPLIHDDIFIIRERGSREESLNTAIDIIGKKDDIIFIGDDICFTPGWRETLIKNYLAADIIGLTTLYPKTDIIQDNGYNLVQIDEDITLEAKNRGKKMSETMLAEYTMCDAPCGCFMLVKKSVFNLVPSFSKDGKNRWGEFLFAHSAINKNAKVAVLSHFVYHEGVSTKSNPEKKLSSISYQLEKEIWKSIVDKHINKEQIKIRYQRILADELQEAIDSSRRILLYGAGTVTEFLLRYLNKKDITICSGLQEEFGIDFHGYKILDYKEAFGKSYDTMIITTLNIWKPLYKEVLSRHNTSNIPVIGVNLEIRGNKYVYNLERII